MPWTYEITTGYLRHDGLLIGAGWSGRNISGGVQGRNNVSAVQVHGIGPCPIGWYTRGEMYNSPLRGPKTIPLIPDPENEMFGRQYFEMHGFRIGTLASDPSNPSSDGCLIQLGPAREQFGTSPDRRLQVVSGVLADIDGEIAV